MAESNGRSMDVKFSSHIRPFTYKSRYRLITPTLGTVSERSVSGSQSSIATLTGSTQNLLEPTKLISMQEDAKSRKISTEVIKRSLYKSVTAPCRRRMMNRYSTSYYEDPSSGRGEESGGGGRRYPTRMFQSLPVTPAESASVSPSHSPTSNKSFFYGFLSRGTTPRCTSPVLQEQDEEEENCATVSSSDDRGLDSIFRPHPRYIPASSHTGIASNDLRLADSFPCDMIGAPNKFTLLRNNSSFKQNDVTVKQPSPV